MINNKWEIDMYVYDSVAVPLRTSDLSLIIGAIDTVIENHIDDEDARAFTDQLHELDTLLRNIRATVINMGDE
jgi:hypothetical protein